MSARSGAGVLAFLSRYAGAAMGPASGAAVQFLLSLVLLSLLSLADFGRFAFLLIVSQLGIGLWSALFGAPLLVEAARGDAGHPPSAAVRAIHAASCVALVPALALLAIIALATGASAGATVLFAVYGMLVLLRQFVRTWSMAHGAPALAVRSDLIYSAALASGTCVLLASRATTLLAPLLALLLSALIGLQPFVAARSEAVLTRPRRADLTRYQRTWKRDSRWSLLGVLSTEATVNSHSYIVTFLFGAAAFAPLAATALLIRPVTVAINALVEFERARFAREFAAGRLADAARARRSLHLVLFAVWCAALGVAAAVLAFGRDLVFRGHFDPSTLVIGTGLWFGVALMRALHAPEGAILLGAGHFRTLALTSVATSVVSLLAVGLGLALGGPLWSTAGIIVGEGSFALLLRRRAQRLLRQEASGDARRVESCSAAGGVTRFS